MAMVDGQRLYDLNIELPFGERKKANIYKGKITRIEPSLEAAFVDYGAERHGFLPLKEISSEYFLNGVESGKPNIKDVLKEGQDIVVQIDKEERGNKGAALTTYVSLAGRFIVLKPNKPRSGGVSRRIVGEDRDLARQAMKDVTVPQGMSVIVRTAGIDRTTEELSWDLENLLAVWEAIKKVAVDRPSPFLIYRESNAVVRALRDYLTGDIGEILVDDEATWEEARQFVEQVMPHNQRKLKHYTDPVPLFTRYQIETQIESAFAHSVSLPSGGSLVIDHTEALVSIDINSARATKGGDIEATALSTNLEAADEIARQLRLRDLGGLIVIDFIDMGPQKNQREVENRLREAVRHDRARVQIGKISRFGLLEMSRQRLRPSLGESSYLTCPRCSGIGTIRSVESLALAILRIIGEEARKERTAKVIAQLPVEVATYLLNEKRDWVQNLESRNDTQVILVANAALETPHYRVRRVRDDQVELPENTASSYALAETDEDPAIPESLQEKKPAEVPAVTTIVPTSPAPPRKEPVREKGPGLFARLLSLFDSSGEDEPKRRKTRTVKTSHKTRDARRGERKRRGDGAKAGDKRRTERAKSASKKGRKTDKKTDKADKADKADKGDARKAQGGKSDRQDKPQQAQADESRDEARKPKRRRSRGGRRRRKSGEAAEARSSDDSPQQQQTQAAGNGSKPPAPEARDTSQEAAAATAEARPSRDRPAERSAADESSPPPARRAPAAAEEEKRSREKTADDVSADEPQHPAASVPETKPAADSEPAEQAPPQAGGNGTGKDEPAPPAAAEEAEPAREASPAATGKYADIGYEDTQPELPVIREPRQRDEDERKQAEREPEQANKEPEKEAKSVEDKPRPEADGDADKPEGRLLPWEPAEPPRDGKPQSDEGSAQR